MLERQNKITTEETAQGDMINCQVTDMGTFDAMGMILCVSCQE